MTSVFVLKMALAVFALVCAIVSTAIYMVATHEEPQCHTDMECGCIHDCLDKGPGIIT